MIISRYYMIISQYYMITSQYYTIIKDAHITKMLILQFYTTRSQYYMIISSYHAMKSWDHRNKSKPKDTERPFKPLPGNRKPPTGKHWAPSSKSPHKMSRKIGDSWKKTGPRERYWEILRWKVAYARQLHFPQKDYSKYILETRFYVMLSSIRKIRISELRNFLLRRQFGRPPRFGAWRQ